MLPVARAAVLPVANAKIVDVYLAKKAAAPVAQLNAMVVPRAVSAKSQRPINAAAVPEMDIFCSLMHILCVKKVLFPQW